MLNVSLAAMQSVFCPSAFLYFVTTKLSTSHCLAVFTTLHFVRSPTYPHLKDERPFSSNLLSFFPIINVMSLIIPFPSTHTSTHSLTHSLTPSSRVLPEKLTGRQLVRTFPAFCGTRMFITAFTRARYVSLSSARPIQSMPSITRLEYPF